MLSSKVNLKEKFSKFTDHWSPRVIAEMNNYQFKVVKVKGEFVWHNHKDTDETFIVIEGEMFVVKQGVEHNPCADKECKILVIEPRGVINTGESGGKLTAPKDVWVQL